MSRREQTLLAVLIALLVLVGGYWFFSGIHQPIRQGLRLAKEELETLRAEVVHLEALAADEESLRETLSELDAQLVQMDTRLPASVDQAAAVGDLHRRARSEGLTLEAIRFDVEPPYRVDLRLRGPLSSQLRWLRGVTDNDRLILLETVHWSRTVEGEYTVSYTIRLPVYEETVSNP